MANSTFNPGGKKGKLHRELGISTSKTIPQKTLKKAEKSKNPTVKGDAIRAETMEHWNHKGKKKPNEAKEIKTSRGTFKMK